MNMMGTIGSMAMGAALGATAMYVATQDRRHLRHNIHTMARGAERALVDLDRAMEHYTR